jgi:hypothetical protein
VKRFICRYPGDPPIEVLELTRAEFLEMFPDRSITITGFDPSTGLTEGHYFPMDEICCDLCNADPGEVIYLYAGTHARCKTCFEQNLKRYCSVH